MYLYDTMDYRRLKILLMNLILKELGVWNLHFQRALWGLMVFYMFGCKRPSSTPSKVRMCILATMMKGIGPRICVIIPFYIPTFRFKDKRIVVMLHLDDMIVNKFCQHAVYVQVLFIIT